MDDMNPEDFAVGDRVEVRSPAEILATLDAKGTLESLPFMPEMVNFCGGTFAIENLASRMCDTIDWSGSRTIPHTFQLGPLRCDGSGHDGCQGDCRLLWKAAWLRRSGPRETPRSPTGVDDLVRAKLLDLVSGNVKQSVGFDGVPGETYRCQATELVRASKAAEAFPYIRELTSRNVAPLRFARVVARAGIRETARKLGLVPHVALAGTRTPPLRRPPLHLQPGEWVEVRSKAEIAETLGPNGGCRGLWFDREMHEFCGKRFQVKERVSRFIHDANGKMIELKSDAVKLDGVTCSGDQSVGRWFCPRALFPYWREDWLKRVEK